MEGQVQLLLNCLFAPIEIGVLVLFRILFAAAMLWTVWDLFSTGSITADYIRPPFHFTYHGFSWVKPWPGGGMYWHCAAIGVLALCVGLGLFYRVCTVLLFVAFTYLFLLEKSLFLNHFYLMCLFCFLLVFLPANRRLSVDAWLRPVLRTDFVPAWTVWVLRFQVGLPYVMGGVAKLKPDWLCGQPMYSWLPISPLRHLAGPIVEQQWVAMLFSWGGALFDLFIVPLLLWPRTRAIAYSVAVLFHLSNAFLFNIGVFPWLMIGATLVFFPPDWPRRLFKLPTPVATAKRIDSTSPAARQKRIVWALAAYVGISLLVPFRHLFYPGNVLWTEEGHLFAWHMMLRTKVTGVQVLVVDPHSQSLEHADLTEWLTRRQLEEMTHDPEMLREFAQFVRDEYLRTGKGDVAVHVVALSSLNGRKAQLLVDPMVDLASQPRTLWHKPWIVPLTEPFRWEPWAVPLSEWERHVELLPPQRDLFNED